MQKPKYNCSITMMKAFEGDCLFSEFHYEGNIFSMLIDTGPMSCWELSLKPFLDSLRKNGKQIDVLLIKSFEDKNADRNEMCRQRSIISIF